MKNHPSKFFIFWLIILATQVARAQMETADHYLLIAENTSTTRSSNPLETLKVQFQRLASSVNLTKWMTMQKPLRAPAEKYEREKHFGSWIVDGRDQSCLNTRARVLIRDSESKVEYSDSNPCSVQKGQWTDKATLKTIEVAREVDVDHFVPLKNAYVSGGWKWSSKVKCMYANFMGNNFHLVPMSGSENRSKSDQGPEGYMPPEKSYRCEYLKQWLTVKAIWRLALNPDEAQAIQDYIQKESCDPKAFTVSQKFLDQQRKWLADNMEMCTSKS